MGSSPGTSESVTRKLIHTDTKMVDEAKVKYICDIYDWDGKGEIDLFFLGDVMYALGLNITKKACVAQGQTDEQGLRCWSAVTCSDHSSDRSSPANKPL